MTWLLAVAVAVAVLLFRVRGVLAVLLSETNMRAGDYEGALRKIRWLSLGIPNITALHKEGLVLSLAGRPSEAAQRYRKALAMAKGSCYTVERLHACLGYALMDLGKYEEAEQCFHHAIEAGDITGNSQDGLAELRVVQGVDAVQALAYAGQAIEYAKRRADQRIPAAYCAHRAWALALLGRGEDAREQLQQALSVPEPKTRSSASLHWRIGMLFAIQRAEEAREHFHIGLEADPRGKYGSRCEQQLRRAA